MPWTNQPADLALSDAMSSCWVRFAATGDPNGGNLPIWTAYDERAEPYLEFGDTIRTREHLLKAECDFVDAYFAAKRSEASP